jgi:hypothetical protein
MLDHDNTTMSGGTMEILIQLVADCLARHGIEAHDETIQPVAEITTPALSKLDVSLDHGSARNPSEKT